MRHKPRPIGETSSRRIKINEKNMKTKKKIRKRRAT